jgi:branched-chain amino acid aminotransferase
MDTVVSNIEVIKAKTSKIQEVDFDNLSFGSVFTDHMLECNYKDGQWQTPKVVPYQPITLDPSAKIFHYGQSIFEGMKAYKDKNDDVFLFRPMDNCKRLNISAKRLAIPEIPESFFMEGLKTLLKVDRDWIPKKDGSSLYIRPFMFASGNGFHASPANEYKFIIALAPFWILFCGKSKSIDRRKIFTLCKWWCWFC